MLYKIFFDDLSTSVGIFITIIMIKWRTSSSLKMADNPVFLAGCQLLSGLQPGECNYLELYDTDF